MNDLISRGELLEAIRSMTVTMGGRELFLPSLKDAVIDAISIAPAVSPTEWIEWYTDQIKHEFHYRIVREDPAVDAVPVRYGRWVDKKRWSMGKWHKWLECSECNYQDYNLETYDAIPFAGPSNYCPNCGAKMIWRDENATD